MRYLVINEYGVYKTDKITQEDFNACDIGEAITDIIDIINMKKYFNGTWIEMSNWG